MPDTHLRHTYIVLIHKAPSQVARLVDRLAADGVDFLLHVDRRSPAWVHAEVGGLAARANVTVLPPRRTPWAGVGLVLATLDALGVAQARGAAYVSLLSGQDYPIKPPPAIERRLIDARGASFIEHFPLPRWPGQEHDGVLDTGWAGGGMSRLHSWSFPVAGREFRIPNNRLRLPVERRTPASIRFYGGAQWWTLSASAVQHIGRVVQQRPDLVRFFRRAASADEMLFQTLLNNAACPAPLLNDSLRYTDWSAGGSHPRTLTASDLPALGDTEALFARKFDGEADSAVLDLIDRDLLRD
jgi:hypothetical protein